MTPFGRLCLLAAALLLAAAPEARAQQNPSADAVAAIAPAGDPNQGHSLFNQTCAHCHGPDAVTGLSERNLRRLKQRYGDDMHDVFITTVTNGRPDKGMPTWGEQLDRKTIDLIYSYLETIQDKAE